MKATVLEMIVIESRQSKSSRISFGITQGNLLYQYHTRLPVTIGLMDDETEDLSWMIHACESIENNTNDEENAKIPTPLKTNTDGFGENHNAKESNDDLPSSPSAEKLHKKFWNLKRQSEKNREILRKLKLVKFHKHKNNLDTLDTLIKKWRLSCQKALNELMEFSPQQPRTTMLQLMQHLGIDPKQVQFDINTNEFKTTNLAAHS